MVQDASSTFRLVRKVVFSMSPMPCSLRGTIEYVLTHPFYSCGNCVRICGARSRSVDHPLYLLFLLRRLLLVCCSWHRDVHPYFPHSPCHACALDESQRRRYLHGCY